MTAKTIYTGLGEVEAVSASWTFGSDVHAGTVQVAVGTFAAPGTWQTPEAHSFSTDGLTVTASVRIGNGYTNPAAGVRCYLWCRVVNGLDVLIEPARSTNPFVTTNPAGLPVTLQPPFLPVGTEQPDPAAFGVWFDTTDTPPVLRYWNGTAWAALIAGASPDLVYGSGVYGSGIYSPSA